MGAPINPRPRRLLALAGFFVCSIVSAEDSSNSLSMAQLGSMSLEELLNVEVSVASKTPNKLENTAAAVYVITEQDIWRSGLRQIPEILRMVPGLEVARSGPHRWSVSARGFNDEFANKLLVLMDGRVLYNPLFSGVYWDAQDTIIEDIERIEVIRGPGASVWGANAVNGVINIITKSSKVTEGGLVAARTGSEIEQDISLRYSGKVNDDLSYRVFVKSFELKDTTFIPEQFADDRWESQRLGWRVDWDINNRDSLALHGDFYGNEEISTGLLVDQPQVDRIDGSGHYLLAKWSRSLADDAGFDLQAYYDRFDRKDLFINGSVKTTDIEFQHYFGVGVRHRVIWGTGFRQVQDKVNQGLIDSIRAGHTDHSGEIYNVFLQDEISLVPDHTILTLGAKVEHNDYTNFEVQPSLRFLTHLAEGQSIWTSVSRATRSPSRMETDAIIESPIIVSGNPNMDSEKLTAYEIGYRNNVLKNLSFDLSVFLHKYSDVSSGEIIGFSGADYEPVIILGNQARAEAKGFELAAAWDVTERWRLTGSYSGLRSKFEPITGPYPVVRPLSTASDSPDSQYQLSSRYIFSPNFSLNLAAYHVGRFDVDHDAGDSVTFLPEYDRIDLRLSWRPLANLEVDLVGHNILDSNHLEFETVVMDEDAYIGRQISASITWRF